MANIAKVNTDIELDSGIVSRGSSDIPKTLSIRMTSGLMTLEVELTGDQVLRMLAGTVQTVPGFVRMVTG